MDKLRFDLCTSRVINEERARYNIGTLSEKILHRTLKFYFDDNEEHHEIRLGRYVADVFDDGQVIEIQTSNLARLKPKLDALLPNYRVTICHPIACKKWIMSIRPSTLNVSKKRKSTLQGTMFDGLFALYQIRDYLKNPNLSICLMLIDIEEFRLIDEKGEFRRRATTYERVPVALEDELFLTDKIDYTYFLPDDLEEFTSTMYAKHYGISISNAQFAINMLRYVDVVERVGKKGNSYLYSTLIKKEKAKEIIFE